MLVSISPRQTISPGGPLSWIWQDMALGATLLVSSSAARHLQSLMYRQVYPPWVRLVLHPTKMCLSEAGTEHSGMHVLQLIPAADVTIISFLKIQYLLWTEWTD